MTLEMRPKLVLKTRTVLFTRCCLPQTISLWFLPKRQKNQKPAAIPLKKNTLYCSCVATSRGANYVIAMTSVTAHRHSHTVRPVVTHFRSGPGTRAYPWKCRESDKRSRMEDSLLLVRWCRPDRDRPRWGNVNKRERVMRQFGVKWKLGYSGLLRNGVWNLKW